jgi:hypothetical protein
LSASEVADEASEVSTLQRRRSKILLGVRPADRPTPSGPAPSFAAPDTYTPRHLAAKILNFRAQMPNRQDSVDRSCLKLRQGRHCSDARVSVVALVLPEATLAPTEAGEAVYGLNGMDIFRLLVAERALDAHANGCSVGDRKRPIVEPIGQDSLRVPRIDEIAGFIVADRPGGALSVTPWPASALLRRAVALGVALPNLAAGPQHHGAGQTGNRRPVAS